MCSPLLIFAKIKCRGVARLFKMRGRQGELRGKGGERPDRDSKWRLSIDLCTKCNFIWGAREEQSFCQRGSHPPPPLATPLTKCTKFHSQNKDIHVSSINTGIYLKYRSTHRLISVLCETDSWVRWCCVAFKHHFQTIKGHWLHSKKHVTLFLGIIWFICWCYGYHNKKYPILHVTTSFSQEQAVNPFHRAFHTH